MEGQQLLRERLVAREHEPARVAAGVGNAEQLQVGDDVLVEDRHVLEVFEQVEDDVGSEVLDRGADDAEIGADALRLHVVAERAERLQHVVLGLPLDAREVGVAGVVRRKEHLLHKGQHLQLRPPPSAHSATRCRPLWRKFMVCTVSRIPKSTRACASGTASRSSSSRHRRMMSSNTWSTVYW